MPRFLPESTSESIDLAVEQHVMRDLDPPSAVVHSKVGLASVLGGILSAASCGQFGSGLTSFASNFSQALHEEMGPFPCALVCGALFAVFPVAILKLFFCGTLQFRTIVRRRKFAVALWFGGVGGGLAAVGHHGANLVEFSGWMVAALLMALVVSRCAEIVSLSTILFPAGGRS